MQSNFIRYHFGLEWEKRKIVRKVHAKRILQTALHTLTLQLSSKQSANSAVGNPVVLEIPACFKETLVLAVTPCRQNWFLDRIKRMRISTPLRRYLF